MTQCDMKDEAKHVANIITGIRVVCAIGLAFLTPFSRWFYILYILGGISDVLDGIVARRFGKETKFGANFDTIADIIFTVIVIIKVVLAINISLWLIIWIICIAVIKCINIIIGFAIYKQFVSEHTIMNKICGVLIFIIPLSIGIFSMQIVTKILIILTCIVATFAAIQEGYCILKQKEIS